MPKKREKSEISKHLSLVNVFFLVFITANLMIAILYLSNDEGVYSSPRSPTPSPVEPELPKCKADGHRIPFNLGMVPLPNTPPQLNNPRIVSQNAFDVVLAVSATDVDGDLVTVSIDWGDGNSSRGRGVIYRHAYNNARFRVYRIQLRAEDTRGGVDTAELQVEITPPVIADINLDGLAWRPGCQITCAPGEHAYCRGASAGQQSSCECY